MTGKLGGQLEVVVQLKLEEGREVALMGGAEGVVVT